MHANSDTRSRSLLMRDVDRTPMVRTVPIAALGGGVMAAAWIVDRNTLPGSLANSASFFVWFSAMMLTLQAWFVTPLVMRVRTGVAMTHLLKPEKAFAAYPDIAAALRRDTARVLVRSTATVAGFFVLLTIAHFTLPPQVAVLGYEVPVVHTGMAVLVALASVAFAQTYIARLAVTLAAWPARFGVCPACGYDLHASADTGPCPECSRPYTKAIPTHSPATEADPADA